MTGSLFARQLKDLEAQRAYFVDDSNPSKQQQLRLDRVIVLFQAKTADLPDTTKSRRETALKNFKKIFTELGHEVFFLCTFALPITWMGNLNQVHTLIEEIQEWWKKVAIPSGFSDLAQRLYEKHQRELGTSAY
ncbi:hypothetical protein BGZ63DRAFT_379448 [Mariannaea sp. PMI_226]|nr:hypothetical protein BGZ63DRAFT_379448 [Mariannaea sp. PMI_226]